MPEFQKWWVAIKWTFQKVLFVTVFFPSYYWNKFACIFHSYLCYFLFLYFVRYCFFYFKTLIQISFLIFITKLMFIINSLLLSNYLIKMSQFPSLHYAFPFFFVIYLSFSWFSLENTYYYDSRRIFLMDTEKPFTFFMVKNGIKCDHNNLLLFNYWPCS